MELFGRSQDYNLPPYVLNVYKEVILPCFEEKNKDNDENDKIGSNRNEIFNKYLKVYGRPISDWQLRQQILPMLEASGLIRQEQDEKDKRKMLVFPTKQ
ncbi:hypothetical protein AGMMS49921_02190 [Endomicrobiia bacterium]|nr:hypothetical protein AGMMS49921_02190 [Endomicrobiia bacterium]